MTFPCTLAQAPQPVSALNDDALLLWPPSIKFIMGIHPGCPVYSIVAASLVAVETDVGETISAAEVAFVCGLWSVGVVVLLSVGPFSYFCFHQLLFPCLEVLVRSASPPHAVSCKVLPGLGVGVKCFHVSLADILVAQMWAAFGSPSRRQLSIENVFWDAAILHAVDMTQPTQPALSKQGEHTWKVGSVQDLGVGHSVLPGSAQDAADASHVEGIESFLLSGICGLRLADVHQCVDDTGIVHYHLGLHCQYRVGPLS